jgi:hypothetical protein
MALVSGLEATGDENRDVLAGRTHHSLPVEAHQGCLVEARFQRTDV